MRFVGVVWIVVPAVCSLAIPHAAVSAANAPAECPTTIPIDMTSLADGLRNDHGIVMDVASAEVPDGSVLAQANRVREREHFRQILRDRAGLPALSPIEAPLPAAKLAEIEGPITDSGRLQVGAAVDIGREVDFSGVSLPATAGNAVAVGGGMAKMLADGSMVWEALVISRNASETRVRLTGLDLSTGTRLSIYNEAGQVFGAYVATGPDGNGEFWAPSVLGDRLRIHIRSPGPAALAASRLTIAAIMHMGSRVSAVSATVRQTYATGPEAERTIDFCGRQVPDCSIDGMCALATKATLIK